MNFVATKKPVLNRGSAPSAFLAELVAWGKAAPDEIFAPNPSPADIYASVRPAIGPWHDLSYRRAAMLEVMRVLAGFESSWKWDAGRDTTNASEDSPHTISAGPFQVSANSRGFGADLRLLAPADGDEFQHVMKTDHPLAMEYIARLLRHTCRHNGPVLRHEIDPWLRIDAVLEFEARLAA